MNKISIIIPIFNGEKTLHRCLTSLQKQDIKDWQALLIDDESSDDSYAIMQSFAQKDKRFLIYQSSHIGVSAARNLMLKKVTTPFVTFLDCDDYWQANYLSEMLQQEDVDLLMCYYLNRYPDNTFTPQQHFLTNRYFKQEAIPYLKRATINNYPLLDLAGPVCKRYKTAILKDNNILFEEDCHIYEDYLFNLDYLNVAKNAYYLNEGLYIREVLDSSLLHSFRPRIYQESIVALEKMSKRIKSDIYAYEQFIAIVFFRLLFLHTFHPGNKLKQKEAIYIFYQHCKTDLYPYWQIFKRSKNLTFRQKIKRLLITKHLLKLFMFLRRRRKNG